MSQSEIRKSGDNNQRSELEVTRWITNINNADTDLYLEAAAASGVQIPRIARSGEPSFGIDIEFVVEGKTRIELIPTRGFDEFAQKLAELYKARENQ